MYRHLAPLFFISFVLACNRENTETLPCPPIVTEGTYDYPVKPGTPEWEAFTSRDQMVAVSQIPEDILETISTDALLETLLHCPMVMDYIFYDELQKGFSHIATDINGFEELYIRDDLYKALIQRLQKMDLHCQNAYPPIIDGAYANTDLAFQTYDFFLFQDDLITKLDQNIQTELLDIIYMTVKQRKEYGHNDYSLLVAYATLGKLMLQLDYLPFVKSVERTPYLAMFCEEIPVYRPIDIFPIDTVEKYTLEMKN